MTLFLAPILFVAAVLYIAYPLMRDEVSGDPVMEASTRDRLIKSKEDAIETLRDIEMDYRMGKLSDEDYAQLKSEFEVKAVEAMKALDGSESGEKAGSLS